MSEEAKKDDGTAEVKDKAGRILKVKQPDFIQEARITRLCGDSSTNVGYMYAYVFPCIWVTSIDGDSVPFPTTAIQLEGVMKRVGRDGAAAVLNHMKSLDGGDIEEEVKN